MKKLTFLIPVLLFAASGAQAECFADYKAKQDNPLRLHYGVAAIDGDCNKGNATTQLADRLSSEGWKLLNVLGVFDDAGLEDRKDSAGEYFLRY